jgi:hypothetical protein
MGAAPLHLIIGYVEAVRCIRFILDPAKALVVNGGAWFVHSLGVTESTTSRG